MVLDSPEEILDLIVSIQSRRMEDQRASLVLPELSVDSSMAESTKKKQTGSTDNKDEINEDHLYDLIMKSQSDRLDDQRSNLGRPKSCSAIPLDIPDLNDVSEIVMAMQAGRFESQRAYLKPPCASDSQLNTGETAESAQKRCVSAEPDSS